MSPLVCTAICGVQLEFETEPLRLLLRVTKMAVLKAAKCDIPALATQLESVNHAYTLLSQSFEPERRSHVGNVFVCVRYFDGANWHLLDDLCEKKEAEYKRQRLVDQVRKQKQTVQQAVSEDADSLFHS